MSQYITISKSDSQFWPLLTGRFSETHFARPIKTLYLRTKDEKVIFKIVEKSQASMLMALRNWYSLSRNIYLLFPFLGGLAFLFSRHGHLPFVPVIVAFVSLQFFLMALTLYSDFHDYINGLDRINEHSAKKPILMGLIRPYQAILLAKIFLALSLLAGSYLFYLQPMTLLFALGSFGIAYFFCSSLFGQKFKGFTSVMSFLLAGPILVWGLEFLLFSQITNLSLLVGFLFGLHALKYDFCKQMRDIYYHTKAQITSLSTSVGFEKSKYFYFGLSIVHLGLLAGLVVRVQQPLLGLLLIVGVCFETYINRLLFSASSFLSSHVGECMGLQKLHYAVENFLLIFVLTYPAWS